MFLRMNQGCIISLSTAMDADGISQTKTPRQSAGSFAFML